MGYVYLFQFWFPQRICLGVGSLGHMLVLSLVVVLQVYTQVTIDHTVQWKNMQFVVCQIYYNLKKKKKDFGALDWDKPGFKDGLSGQ